MFFRSASIVVVLLATECYAHSLHLGSGYCGEDPQDCAPYGYEDDSVVGGKHHCTSQEIIAMDVNNCVCQPERFGCQNFTSCGVCGIPALRAYRNMTSCDWGCTDRDWNCEGCGIWFHSLCDCLQQPTKCTTSTPVQSGTPPVWALLETTGTADNLITITERVPGILDTVNDPTKFNDGWIFAQEHYNPQQEALALNSFRARTHEQIHIHVCRRNADLPGILSKETPNCSNSFVPLKNDSQLHCVTISSKSMLRTFATDIARFLTTTTECTKLVGAGIIQDDKGNNTWGCVSLNSAGPLAKFC